MKVNVDLISDGVEIEEKDICPFISNFQTGAGSYLGKVSCIKNKCAIWDDKRKCCSLKKNDAKKGGNENETP